MSGGLLNTQKEELRFIRHLVSDVDAFGSEKFKELMGHYEKADQDIYKILKESRELAQERYEKYLDAKVLRIGGISSLGFEKVIDGEEGVLSTITNKLRSQAYKDKEFRGYLSKSMMETTLSYDKELRKAYREVEKERKLDERSKGKRFSFGLSR
ncbi:MAG: hypothetical protein CL676_03585 [Bdellovibrionaceae bacterium]|nr:hypothetical protein [Pseudobdellovibrionaceae bacterium]|tara:strand:+ start:3694 stop:4158 length:465 start_codon:yes stop_codon:yes gene_type:complete